MCLEVHIETAADPAAAATWLEDAFDLPLSSRDRYGTVGPWTIFGAIEGDQIRVETAGAFEGWTARNGYGFWQPVFRGRLRTKAGRTILEGRIRFRTTVWILIAFLMVLALSLGGLVPSALTDIIEGDVGTAVPKLALIVGIVVIPAFLTLRVVRRGRREAHALRIWLEKAMTAPAQASIQA